jgi:hypothetical protein
LKYVLIIIPGYSKPGGALKGTSFLVAMVVGALYWIYCTVISPAGGVVVDPDFLEGNVMCVVVAVVVVVVVIIDVVVVVVVVVVFLFLLDFAANH